MSALERLDRYLDAEAVPDFDLDEDPEAPESERWQIGSLSEADWGMRKAARIQATLDDVRAAAQQRRDEINAWEAAEATRLGRELDWWRVKLVEWHRRRYADDPRGSVSISLPSGRLVSTKKPDRWEIGEQFTAWARDHASHLLRTVVTVKGPGSAIDPAAVRHVLAGLLGEERVAELLAADEQPDRSAIKDALSDEALSAEAKRRMPRVADGGQVVHPETGEIVPGLSWSEGHRTFDIEPGGDR